MFNCDFSLQQHFFALSVLNKAVHKLTVVLQLLVFSSQSLATILSYFKRYLDDGGAKCKIYNNMLVSEANLYMFMFKNSRFLPHFLFLLILQNCYLMRN